MICRVNQSSSSIEKKKKLVLREKMVSKGIEMKILFHKLLGGK